MSRALEGRRIVNTRAAHQAPELDTALIAAGAIPVSFPCIEIVSPADPSHLSAAVDLLVEGSFDWLVLTSVNAVTAIAGVLNGRSARARIAAIGPATADTVSGTLEATVDFVASKHTASELANELPIAHGDRVLLPVSEIADSGLELRLTERGGNVTHVTAYRTVTGSGGVDLAELLGRGEVDAIIFASGSAVTGCLRRVAEANDVFPALFDLPAVCIGPSTEAAAKSAGFMTVLVAARQSNAGLIDSLTSLFSFQPQGGNSWR